MAKEGEQPARQFEAVRAAADARREHHMRTLERVRRDRSADQRPFLINTIIITANTIAIATAITMVTAIVITESGQTAGGGARRCCAVQAPGWWDSDLDRNIQHSPSLFRHRA